MPHAAWSDIAPVFRAGGVGLLKGRYFSRSGRINLELADDRRNIQYNLTLRDFNKKSPWADTPVG
jgi:hypothetical protein